MSSSLSTGPREREPTCLPDPLDELANGLQPKRARKRHERVEPRRALAPLEQPDRARMQFASIGELFLGKAQALAMMSQVFSELLTGPIHAYNCLA